ncbi:MAG: sugar phosphate isomerase/epimerase [Thermoguttaceae bacterium]|nr:sugar phosphate isomerase/epimerase [Thermoguttaceae bacterium]
MQRRTFIQTGLTAAVAGLSCASSFTFAATGKKIPIALELYSLRRTIKDDVPGTLKKVAAMGYQGVETAGTYGLEAKELKKMLDDVGLPVCSAHIGLAALLGDQFEKTVEYNKILGNSRLIVPGGIQKAIVTNAGNQITATLFNELAAKAKKCGVEIGFHCHTGDFDKVDGTGKPAWEVFLTRTNPEVIGQIDIGWCNNSGNDPAAMIRKFPGRAKVVHVKSNNNEVKGCVVAEAADKVPWKTVFEACESVGGTQWYIVEQEQFKVSELDACKECIDNLRKLGK